MNRQTLTDYLDEYLNIHAIKDYGPQGLQVETDNRQINKIALAVDVSPAIIDTAAQWEADLLLVHHGIFWRQLQRIAGPLGKRVRLMMKHGINLYAAHLALDAHPEVGNNAVLASLFGLLEVNWWFEPMGVPLAVSGRVEPIAIDRLVTNVESRLETRAQLLAHGPQTVRQLAILSGSGAEQVEMAKHQGADTFLTGERSHAHYWAAADHEMNVIFAGHYATETVGVKALGSHLATQFDLEVKFFDFPTQM